MGRIRRFFAQLGLVNFEPPLVISNDDPDMVLAIANARGSLAEFFARLADPADDQDDFRVKVVLGEDRDRESIWAGELGEEAGGWSGVLINVPYTPGFYIGQRIEFPKTDIVDWSYWQSNVLRGGFTMRVMLDRVSPKKARAIRQQMGWQAE